MFRTPRRLGFCLKQSSHHAETSLRVIYYSRSEPLNTARSFSAPDELLTSKCRQLRQMHRLSDSLLVPLEKQLSEAEDTARTQKRQVALTLMVKLAGFFLLLPRLRRSGAGWMRRRASLRSALLWFSNPLGGFSVVQRRFLRARHHLTARMHSPRTRLACIPCTFLMKRTQTAAAFTCQQNI